MGKKFKQRKDAIFMGARDNSPELKQKSLTTKYSRLYDFYGLHIETDSDEFADSIVICGESVTVLLHMTDAGSVTELCAHTELN